MRTLIVEDDHTSCIFLRHILSPYSTCDIATNGKEGVAAFEAALDCGQPYDLVCLDIMMPEMDGREVLRYIREREKGLAEHISEAAIVMTTALDDPANVAATYAVGGVTTYVPKPIDRAIFLAHLHNIGVLAAL